MPNSEFFFLAHSQKSESHLEYTEYRVNIVMRDARPPLVVKDGITAKYRSGVLNVSP